MRVAARNAKRAGEPLQAGTDQLKTLEDSRRRREEAMDRLNDITSTSKPAEDGNAESPNIEYSRRESVSVAVDSRPARLTDASGLDLDDDIFGNLDDSLEDSRDMNDTESAHQTRSTDTSSFNVAMFRRRGRQSSIVGKDDAPIRPSSRGPNTPSFSSHLNLGKFKRRQREPSILGTAQKERAPRPQSQASNYGSVAGDESGPEGESTPLDKTKRFSVVAPQADSSREGSPTLHTRKRKSLEDQTGREKRPALDTHTDEVVHQSIEVDSPPLSSPLTLSSQSPSTPLRADDPDMAPPASGSSSNGSPVMWPSLDTLAHRNYHARSRAVAKTPEPVDPDMASDISSPPSLTHSPNYGPPAAVRTKPKRKPTTAALPKVMTADLTSLLPRRRNRAARGRSGSVDDPYDISSSDENYGLVNEEDDELSYVDAKAARRRRGAGALAQTTTNRSAKGSKTAAPVAAAGKENGKVRRTYGSRSSDKENEDGGDVDNGELDTVELGSVIGDDGEEEADGEATTPSDDAETSQMIEARIGPELKNAKKKFKEVDRWELSFEEVTESSSPIRDAR